MTTLGRIVLTIAVPLFLYMLGCAILVTALLLMGGCGTAPTITRIEFSCVSKGSGDVVLTDCADPQTWREWVAKQGI